MINRRLIFVVLLHVCFANVGLAQSPKPADPKDGIFLDVGSAGVRRIKIAFPILAGGAPAAPQDKKPALDSAISEEFKRLFDFTMSFDVIPQASFPSSAEAFSVPLPTDRWKSLGVELVVLGTVEKEANNTRSLEFRLYDAQKGTRLMGKRFSKIPESETSVVIKRFSDLVMKELTGQMGVFSTKMAFAAAAKPGKAKEIYIADFDGRNVVQITNDGVPHMSPSWSPDGSKLTYTSFKSGRAQIYVYNLLTRKSLPLTRTSGNTSGAEWHPDGKSIAFSMSSEGKTAIYTMKSFDGTEVKPLVQGSGLEVEPAYSPDGKFIAFASGRFGNPHLFVRDLSTGGDTRITFAGWYNSSPSWRPDGKKLIFAGYDREIDRYDLFTVNPDGRQLERITLDQGDNENPTFSPDGRFVLFQSNRRDGVRGKQPGYRLFVMTKDGAGQRPLAMPFSDVTMPSWSPYLVGL
jgi:TolB protein